MLAKIEWEGAWYEFDFSNGKDISMEMKLDSAYNANAYYAPFPYTKPFQMDKFIGLIEKGSPVNYRHIFFSPHGNGTHTECVSHVVNENISINQCIDKPISMAYVCSVYPTLMDDGDKIILLSSLQDEIDKAKELKANAFIIRSLPNETSKQLIQYSGTNPPYLEAEIGKYLCENNFMHLLVDLPSLDREMDEGKLATHKNFWNFPDFQSRKNATITELVYIPNEVRDGLYLMHLQVANMIHDALPSRPILYSVKKTL